MNKLYALGEVKKKYISPESHNLMTCKILKINIICQKTDQKIALLLIQKLRIFI